MFRTTAKEIRSRITTTAASAAKRIRTGRISTSKVLLFRKRQDCEKGLCAKAKSFLHKLSNSAESAVNYFVPPAGYNLMTDNRRMNGVPNEIFRRNFFCRLVKFLL